MGQLFWRHGSALSWGMMMPWTGVHHTDITSPMDIQVYRDGWLLTRPIGYGYGVHELASNAPVYAGLNKFRQSGMTWADSGAGWTAIAGVTRGSYFTSGYPAPPEFLHYGGRVVVFAEAGGEDVVIVRDSVDMDDPRSLPLFSSYRATPTYPHQSRIAEYEGKMWALWHMPQSPNLSGTTLSWTAPNGREVTLQAFADQQVEVLIRDDQSVLGSAVSDSEKGWHARLHSDAPVLFQVFHTGAVPVSRSGDTITVAGVSWTITSAGVTGP